MAPLVKKLLLTVSFLGATACVGLLLNSSKPLDASSSAQSVVLPAVTVHFSSSAFGSVDAVSYRSPEFIYARLHFSAPQYGKNKLEGRWMTPAGYPQEFTSVPIDFGNQARRDAYLWLRFNGGNSGGGLSPLTLSNDRSASDFNGVWTLQTFWNGQPLRNSTFSVSGMLGNSNG
jgi:hypothetical protein